LTGLNYSLLSYAILSKILEIADVETSNNLAASAKATLNSFTSRSAMPERTREILVSGSSIRSPRRFVRF
jgi:hypothetical protein